MRDTDPCFQMEEHSTYLSWEVNGRDERPEDEAMSNFQKGLTFLIFCLAGGAGLFFHGAFFGFNWISLVIVLTGLPTLGLLAALVKVRILGNMSAEQTWILDDDELKHIYTSWRGSTVERSYARTNLKFISVYPDRIMLHLKRSRGGFSTHVMSPPVSFSQACRDRLATALNARGVATET